MKGLRRRWDLCGPGFAQVDTTREASLPRLYIRIRELTQRGVSICHRRIDFPFGKT
jgi:hypothetical protein